MKIKTFIFVCIIYLSSWSKPNPFCSQSSLLESTGPYPLTISPNEIGEIKTHQFLFKHRGKTTALKYHVASALSPPKKGTLVYLCGGPGFACPKRAFNLPENYDIVTIHYLGIGNNRVLNKAEDMAVENQGEAVAQMINDLARPDIIILGHSYGTAVATVAASKYTHKPNTEKKSNLKGVILTGVVGPSAGATYGAEYPNIAKQAWDALSNMEQKQFRKQYLKISKNLSLQKKANLDKILSGPLIYGPTLTTNGLRSFIKSPQDFADFRVLTTLPPEVKEGIWQQRAAACELFETVIDLKNEKVFGGLVTPNTFSPEICDCRLLPARWKPDDYQIKDIPVVYLNGTSDPATPVAGAKQHFNGQTETSEKVFLAEPNGGHAEFINENGKMKNCIPEFLEEISKGSLKSIESKKDIYVNNGCKKQTNFIPFEPESTK